MSFFEFNWMEIIRFSIGYLPTILFILIILIGIIKGYIRGFRKTSIYLLHSIICATICLILFFVLVNVKAVDEFLLTITNNILGSKSIQEILDVSRDSTTFREIFIEYIPKQMNFFDGLTLILSDNGAHLSTLVDVAYRLIFGIALFILYLILRGVLYVGYNAFRLSKRYDRKRDDLYQNGYVDTPSKKKRALGATLGGFVGLFKGVLILSFFGTFLFIFAGGIGDKSRDELKLDNENYNLIYGAYSEIGTYGSQGIYKILNTVRDEKDVPYYLFAANLIFKGNLNDEVRGINSNVYLTDEISAYVEFSRDTLALFIKYDKENIINMVNNNFQINPMDEIVKVFQIEGFQNEFKELILKFDQKTYFINLTLALTDTIAANLSKLEFSRDYADEALVPIRIMFEDGYLCPTIPNENELIINGESKDLGHIRPSDLLNRNDFYNIYDIFINYIKNYYNFQENTIDSVISIIKNSMDNIKDLSILKTERSKELDPVLKRLFIYYEYKYLDGISLDVLNSVDEDKLNIKWIDELNSISDYVVCGLDIYEAVNAKLPEDYTKDGITAKDFVIEMLDVSHRDNIRHLIITLSGSKIIGRLLSTGRFVYELKNGLNNLSKESDFPVDISMGDIYDENGEFKGYGELHYLLKAIDLLANDEESKDAFISLLFNEDFDEVDEESETDSEDPLMKAFRAFGSSKGLDILNNLVSSEIMASIFSNYIISINTQDSNFILYIDDSIKLTDKEGNVLNIIEPSEIKKLFNNATRIMDLINDLNDEELNSADVFKNLLYGSDIDSLIDSKIIEGSLSNYLYNQELEFGDIIIPNKLKTNTDVLVTRNNKNSEIKKVVLATKIEGSDILFNISEEDDPNQIIEEEESKPDIFDFILNLSSKDVDTLLQSDILHYSISNKLINSEEGISGVTIIVPYASRIDDIAIDKLELKAVLLNIGRIIPIENDEINPNDVLTNIIDNQNILDNLIINATAAKYIIDNFQKDDSNPDEEGFSIELPDNYKVLNNKGDREDLYYTKKCIWYSEIKSLVSGLNIALRGTDGNINLDTDIEEKIKLDIPSYNLHVGNNDFSKLDTIYASNILSNNISKVIIDVLENTFKDEPNDYINQNTIELIKNDYDDRVSKNEIAGLINLLAMYDLTVSNLEDDPNGSFSLIEDDVMEHSDLLLEPYDSELVYNPEKNNLGRKFDYIFVSSIIKKVFTNSINSTLFENGEANESTDPRMEILTDTNGLVKKEEVETIIKISKYYGFSLSEGININSFNNIREYKNSLMNGYILSIMIFEVINENNIIDIPQYARISIGNLFYDALTRNEIEAILLLVGDDSNPSKFGINFNNSVVDIEENYNYSKLKDNIYDNELETISKSYVASSYFYNNILKKNELVESYKPTVDQRGVEYLELNEFKNLLKYINNYGEISNMENSDLTIVFIREGLESDLITCIMFDSIVNNLYDSNTKPSKLNTCNKKTELTELTNVMEIFEMQNIGTINFNLVTDLTRIKNNVDNIYKSIITSNRLSSIVEDTYSVGLNSDNYESDYKRIKKDTMKSILNI